MKKNRLKIIKCFVLLFAFFWIALFSLFVSMEIQFLDQEEEQKLKEGKQFWEWQSPHGPLAMHYVEKGIGSDHLLFLHGFRSHSFTWRALLDPLAEAGFHVWAIDLIGYGLSDKPVEDVYSADLFVQQINAFMKAKGINQAHIIGNSMGGGLALLLALLDPGPIRSLMLLSALGYPLETSFSLTIGKHIAHIWPAFMNPTMVRFGLKQIVYHADKISDEQVDAYSLPYRFPGGVKASLLTLEKFDNQHLIDMQPKYSKLKMPTLIIWGKYDSLLPIAHYEKFNQDFPHAEKLLINNCGHLPQEEAPEQVLNAILKFLKSS